jgi:hypothetical protein
MRRDRFTPYAQSWLSYYLAEGNGQIMIGKENYF